MDHLSTLLERYPSLRECETDLKGAFQTLVESFAAGGKLLLCGNGGSASDSAHIEGELMKGFLLRRPLSEAERSSLSAVCSELGSVLGDGLQGGLPTVALAAAGALPTAIANDNGADLVFAQQVWGLGRADDVLLGITTSGNSRNILLACAAAKAKGMKVIALTGRGGGKIKALADVTIAVPESETFRVQELHLPVYHCLCLMLEEHFFAL